MNIAYYTSNKVDDIQFIKEYYSRDTTQHNNFFILCEDILSEKAITETACINAYSKKWMTGKIIFTNITDYLKHKDGLIANSVLLVDQKDLVSLDKTILKEFNEILVKNNQHIERVSYEKLQ